MAAAIVDGDRALAVRRRDNGKWEPPGGTLERDESIEEGLKREVREEVGLEISNPVLSGVYKNIAKGIVALVFRTPREKGPEPTTSAEVMETRWMTADDIRASLDPAYACRLLDALQPGPPVIRIHDGTHLLEG